MTSPPTVFVVDDDDPVLDSIEIFLGVLGIPVKAFRSADAFLNAYAESWTGCLLVDLRMPEMGGLELIEELRRRRIVLQTIVMTGHADGESLEGNLDIRPEDVLQKPISAGQLKSVIERRLARCVRDNELEMEA